MNGSGRHPQALSIGNHYGDAGRDKRNSVLTSHWSAGCRPPVEVGQALQGDGGGEPLDKTPQNARPVHRCDKRDGERCLRGLMRRKP